jgi:hypothetical protein
MPRESGASFLGSRLGGARVDLARGDVAGANLTWVNLTWVALAREAAGLIARAVDLDNEILEIIGVSIRRSSASWKLHASCCSVRFEWNAATDP